MAKEKIQYQLFKEFDGHFQVEVFTDPSTGLSGAIAIHRSFKNHPSFGATRFYHCDSMEEAVQDSLRLSRLMSYKSALAQLPYGGAKGVIVKNSSRLGMEKRQALLAAYCGKVNELGGRFITGADVGINFSDLALMYKHSRYIVGLKSRPVAFTALGLAYSLEVALKEVFGDSSLSQRSFAIQGGGKIGSALLKHIYPKAKKIYLSDTNPITIAALKRQYPKIEIIKPQDIHRQKADVFSPCALGHSINRKVIKKLSCRIILGGANNQLENREAGEEVFRAGILYAPDYVVNSGGLISVTEEYENPESDEAKLEKKVRKIAQTLKSIIAASKKRGLATNLIADQMAEEIINKKMRSHAVVARV